MLTLCIGFVGRRFQKMYCQMYHTILSDIMKPFYKMAAISKVLRSISKTMRRRASNVDSMYRFCGAYIPEKVLPNTSCYYIRRFGGHFQKRRPFFKVIRVIFENTRQIIVTLESIIFREYYSDSILLLASHNGGHNLAGCCCNLF